MERDPAPALIPRSPTNVACGLVLAAGALLFVAQGLFEDGGLRAVQDHVITHSFSRQVAETHEYRADPLVASGQAMLPIGVSWVVRYETLVDLERSAILAERGLKVALRIEYFASRFVGVCQVGMRRGGAHALRRQTLEDLDRCSAPAES